MEESSVTVTMTRNVEAQVGTIELVEKENAEMEQDVPAVQLTFNDGEVIDIPVTEEKLEQVNDKIYDNR